MAYLDNVFPNEKWVVYYDLPNRKYHIDSYLIHKKLVAKGKDKQLLFLFLGSFDSHAQAVAFIKVKQREDRNFIFKQ